MERSQMTMMVEEMTRQFLGVVGDKLQSDSDPVVSGLGGRLVSLLATGQAPVRVLTELLGPGSQPWEYKVVQHVVGETTFKQRQARFNKLGQEGWEMVTSYRGGNSAITWFKRRAVG